MEGNSVVDQTKQHPDDPNLDNSLESIEINNANESDPKEKTVEVIDVDSALNEGEKEDNQKNDQDSVIIEEVQNKIIDLNDDSEEESELNLENAVVEVEMSVVAKTSFEKSADTEFVVVNEANVAITDIADETEVTNKYAVEDIQIKDELSESITADLNTNDILENDPMDLLELNNRSECTSTTRSQEDTEDYGDDVSSIGSSSIRTASSSSGSILDWIKDYPWFLYEEGDEPFGYCLYCDAKISTKFQRFVKQHGLSLYHKERCENYLAFRDEEEKNGLSMKLVEIKEEFGTDSRVEALKLKRKSQSGALNNFNWRRWLENCPWLERDSAEGTVGYCKYCLVHVNVEFSYLRERHQEAGRHKEAEKQYEISNERRDQNKSTNVNEESVGESSQSKNQRWLEFVKKEPTVVRCKLCRTKMFKNSFSKHLRTNLHEHNETIYLQNLKELDEEPTKKQDKWKLHTKRHPWLVSDPVDPTIAYCKYCEKRIVYGSSAVKRALHENSTQHKHNESAFKQAGKEHKDSEENVNRSKDEDNDQNKENEESEENGEIENNENNGDEGEEEEEEEEDEEEEEQEVDKRHCESEKGNESEEENETKKRVYKLSDEWLNQYSWSIKYKKDPKNFIYCIYCKKPLSVSNSRLKHQSTSYHIAAEKEFLEQQAKKQKLQEKKQTNETQPFYEWAVHLKNNPSSYSCRYCRVRISKKYSKKQHASGKIHQINENIYKNNRRSLLRTNKNEDEVAKVINQQSHAAATTKKIQTFGKVVVKAPSTVALIKQYQKKFSWLSYKRNELRSHYGHCKICDSSLYIRSLKHILRHTRSGKHANLMKKKKKQKVEERQDDANEISTRISKKPSKEELETSLTSVKNFPQNEKPLPNTVTEAIQPQTLASQKVINYRSTIAEMKKRFSWIEQSEKANQAFCHFCNLNIPLKIIFLRNHSNSKNHRSCVINYYSNDGQKSTREKMSNNTELDSNKKCDQGDDDVMVVEENNEEILISEQDENWTVKSETMDEHEELDYLLQRSFNNNQNASNVPRNVRKRTNVEDDPPAKRPRRSQSFKRLNDSNTSLVANLLTTPLTLASCLGPFIQQHIQMSQISQTKPNESMSVAPKTLSAAGDCENTYDLFFKSISETMKKLPVDLAAEGKLRVMQIICDLELQALKRQQTAQSESIFSNTSSGQSYQATSTSTSIHPGCNNSFTNDITEQNDTGNETVIGQLSTNAEVSPPLATHLPPKVINPSLVEKPSTSTASPIISVVDKSGLQALQFKPSVSKQISRNTTNTSTITSNAGIRCIPFKNLSQSAAPDTSSAKITRIQVPVNVAAQNTNSKANANAANTSKNLINYRSIQITKRINTPTTVAQTSGPQQQQKCITTNNGNSPRTFITNIQPQLQRWGCSVNGSASQHAATSNTVLQQLSSHQTSTPISKK